MRLDHAEPDLNAAVPGALADTTSPLAMVQDLRKVLLGDALSQNSRQRLQSWMIQAQTGLKRLRAGIPADWAMGDKTGSGGHGTANVIAIMLPPEQPPLLAAIFLTETELQPVEIDAFYAKIGALVAEEFRG